MKRAYCADKVGGAAGKCHSRFASRSDKPAREEATEGTHTSPSCGTQTIAQLQAINKSNRTEKEGKEKTLAAILIIGAI